MPHGCYFPNSGEYQGCVPVPTLEEPVHWVLNGVPCAKRMDGAQLTNEKGHSLMAVGIANQPLFGSHVVKGSHALMQPGWCQVRHGKYV
jgi:hypothetical protein